MPSKSGKTQADIEWENRILCSDESCIGIIGPDGRCKECGKPYAGDLTWTPPKGDDAEAEIFEADVDLSDDEDKEIQGDDEWENRILCSDESCIGVIGPDGRCKECGKPFKK
jgi:hypothetical protein